MNVSVNSSPKPTESAKGAAVGAVPLAEVVYGKIKSAIIHSELPPGEQVAENQIATLLKVSRTPVHQALVLLEQEGWVRVLPKRGVIIAPVSAEEMRNIYEILMGLESIAAERLASRPADTDDGIDAMIAEAAEGAKSALDRKDLSGWAEADDKFHRLLVELCGNPDLYRLARSIMDKAHRARLITLFDRPPPVQSNIDHDEILDAIRRRDSNAARDALRMHRMRGMAALIPILEKAEANQRRFLQP
ncbi:GntR family transcriptional regulator [Paracoccus marinaquae]|uniref:GntR family transcriptional regulator n=1 Tax=Paracoccus marinaquae TaxID=2841926 RepID=A0ABS6AP25_9RHOB|nr:GntR family transcriptional regulator [Paracoccus marinaquae]MBU3032338.1 GntR family transcriptional regulator [Paracoccus marinaquae]